MAYEYLEINGVKVPLPLSAFPVGSIYMSTESVSPASFIGGTWERIKDKFLLAAGTSYEAGNEGGSASHTHSLENGYAKYNPSGTSGITNIYKVVEPYGYSVNKSASDSDNFNTDISKTVYDAVGLGGNTDGASHLPPYLTVYMWKRVA